MQVVKLPWSIYSPLRHKYCEVRIRRESRAQHMLLTLPLVLVTSNGSWLG